MKKLYIVDLFKNLIHNKNIFALIYLFMNLFVVCACFYYVLGQTFDAILLGLLIYVFAALVGLSPIGEWFLRRSHGCVSVKKYKDKNAAARLVSLFEEVRAAANKNSVEVREMGKISLFIHDSDELNAFAVGRKTICVTSALMELPDSEIKAILGHELGHLATHDTDLLLLITTGNFMVTAIVTIIRAIIWIIKGFFIVLSWFCGNAGGIVRFFTNATSFLTLVFVNVIMFIWTKIGIWMVMKTSRDAEFEADAFSCRLGYSHGMLTFFRKLAACEPTHSVKKGADLFSALSASHPKTSLRIKRVEEYRNNLPTPEGVNRL